MVKTVLPVLLTTLVIKLIRKCALSVQCVILQRKLDQQSVSSVFLLLFLLLFVLQGIGQKNQLKMKWSIACITGGTRVGICEEFPAQFSHSLGLGCKTLRH